MSDGKVTVNVNQPGPQGRGQNQGQQGQGQNQGGQGGASSSWPLEAERVSLDDPLMECLAIIAAENGRRTTAAALSAGLPIHGKQMASPAAFVRAADRISMTARMVRRRRAEHNRRRP